VPAISVIAQTGQRAQQPDSKCGKPNSESDGNAGLDVEEQPVAAVGLEAIFSGATGLLIAD
jgi:hypothetical protein